MTVNLFHTSLLLVGIVLSDEPLVVAILAYFLMFTMNEARYE